MLRYRRSYEEFKGNRRGQVASISRLTFIQEVLNLLYMNEKEKEKILKQISAWKNVNKKMLELKKKKLQNISTEMIINQFEDVFESVLNTSRRRTTSGLVIQQQYFMKSK